MPGLMARQVDIEVILEGEIWPKNVKDVELSRRGRSGVSLALLVGSEGLLVRMSPSVPIGDARDGRIDEDDGAVTGQQVATIEPFAEQQRILIREVIIGGEQLVEAPAITREQQRRPARFRLAVCRRDPK